MTRPAVGGGITGRSWARRSGGSTSTANYETELGALKISSVLPIERAADGRSVVFLDRFGPLTFSDGKPMDVAPHPHMGLQTVTWLLEGEVVHDDSLGHESVLRPSGVNVMTSGRESPTPSETPRDHTGRLNGVQLWVALPVASVTAPRRFTQVTEVSGLESPDAAAACSREHAGTTSPAPHYSEPVGADLDLRPRRDLRCRKRPDYEHAMSCWTATHGGRPAGSTLAPVLPRNAPVRRRTSAATSGGRVLLIGGAPFPETILMWWNFVARTPDEIARRPRRLGGGRPVWRRDGVQGATAYTHRNWCGSRVPTQ